MDIDRIIDEYGIVGVIGIIVAVLMVVALCGFLSYHIYMSLDHEVVTGKVKDFEWNRTIALFELKVKQDSSWESEMPNGAYNISCREKTRNEGVMVEVTKPAPCPTNDPSSQCYTSENVPATPDKQDWCSYTYDRWVGVSDQTTTGTNHEPYYASVTVSDPRKFRAYCNSTKNATYYAYSENNPNSEPDGFEYLKEWGCYYDNLSQVDWYIITATSEYVVTDKLDNYKQKLPYEVWKSLKKRDPINVHVNGYGDINKITVPE